jgi:hypothetical protein
MSSSIFNLSPRGNFTHAVYDIIIILYSQVSAVLDCYLEGKLFTPEAAPHDSYDMKKVQYSTEVCFVYAVLY